MEANFLFYLVPLSLLPLSLYLLTFRRNNGSDDLKNMPPGSKGWPILGENMKLGVLGPHKFFKTRMEKYSPEVFQTSLFGEKIAVFCGAQGNKFLFMNENKVFSSWSPKSSKKVVLFPEYVESSPKEVSALRRSFHYNFLKPEALKQYIPVMDAMAREHLGSEWEPNSLVKVLPLSKKYTFELACRLFLRVVDPVRIKKLSDPFTQVTKGLFSVPMDLPGTAYNGAIKGGKMVRDELMRIINERRKELMEKQEGEGEDLLSKMLLARDEEGELLSEMEISNNIVEQMAIAKSKGPDELLKWEDIEKMKYSWNVVRESLRLTPPGLGGVRETTTEFSYAGFTIPKGWKALWTVHSTHKNPDYFPEPEKFDPSRFEGSGPAPYTFVPFGGGPTMCPGKEYARLQVLIFMHNVVTRFKLRKAIPNEKIVFHASPTPAYGLPLHLRPHQN